MKSKELHISNYLHLVIFCAAMKESKNYRASTKKRRLIIKDLMAGLLKDFITGRLKPRENYQAMFDRVSSQKEFLQASHHRQDQTSSEWTYSKHSVYLEDDMKSKELHISDYLHLVIFCAALKESKNYRASTKKRRRIIKDLMAGILKDFITGRLKPRENYQAMFERVSSQKYIIQTSHHSQAQSSFEWTYSKHSVYPEDFKKWEKNIQEEIRDGQQDNFPHDISRCSARKWNHLHFKRRGWRYGLPKLLLHDGRPLIFGRRRSILRRNLTDGQVCGKAVNRADSNPLSQYETRYNESSFSKTILAAWSHSWAEEVQLRQRKRPHRSRQQSEDKSPD